MEEPAYTRLTGKCHRANQHMLLTNLNNGKCFKMLSYAYINVRRISYCNVFGAQIPESIQ
jgi:hypothetical protein